MKEIIVYIFIIIICMVLSGIFTYRYFPRKVIEHKVDTVVVTKPVVQVTERLKTQFKIHSKIDTVFVYHTKQDTIYFEPDIKAYADTLITEDSLSVYVAYYFKQQTFDVGITGKYITKEFVPVVVPQSKWKLCIGGGIVTNFNTNNNRYIAPGLFIGIGYTIR